MRLKAIVGICLLLAASAFAFPARVISTTPAITEIIFAIGADSQLIGVTTNCNYPEAAKAKAKIGGFFLNLETISSLKPDLIIMQTDAQMREIDRLRRQRFNIMEINLRSLNDVYFAILDIERKLGREGEARRIVGEMRQRVEKTRKKVKEHQPALDEVLNVWGKGIKKRQALVIVGFNPIVVAGGGTFIDDILSAAGVDNVAKRTRSAYPQYSFEKLVSENPQYIIIPQGAISRQTLENNRYWQSLDAVKNKRIMFIDQDILCRPGPRVVLAIEQISDFIY